MATTQLVPIPLGTRTDTFKGPDYKISAQAITVYLNVESASGTGGLTVRLLGKDPSSGKYALIGSAPTAVTATTGTNPTAYQFGLADTTTGGGVLNANAMMIPAIWAIQVTCGDTTVYQYSVGVDILHAYPRT